MDFPAVVVFSSWTRTSIEVSGAIGTEDKEMSLSSSARMHLLSSY